MLVWNRVMQGTSLEQEQAGMLVWNRVMHRYQFGTGASRDASLEQGHAGDVILDQGAMQRVLV